MENLIALAILLIPVGAIVFYQMVLKNPTRWIEPMSVIVDSTAVTIELKNKTGKRIDISQLGIAWQTAPRQFTLLQFEEKERMISGHSVFTESLPIKGIEEKVNEMLSSTLHKITVKFTIDGKQKASGQHFSTIKTSITNQTQPVATGQSH